MEAASAFEQRVTTRASSEPRGGLRCGFLVFVCLCFSDSLVVLLFVFCDFWCFSLFVIIFVECFVLSVFFEYVFFCFVCFVVCVFCFSCVSDVGIWWSLLLMSVLGIWLFYCWSLFFCDWFSMSMSMFGWNLTVCGFCCGGLCAVSVLLRSANKMWVCC